MQGQLRVAVAYLKKIVVIVLLVVQSKTPYYWKEYRKSCLIR